MHKDSLRWEEYTHTSILGVILVVSWLVIFVNGVLIYSENHHEAQHCRAIEDGSPNAACSRAETYEVIGIAMAVFAFIAIVIGIIIVVLAGDSVEFTCPRCQMSKRIGVRSVPTSCPNCGLQVGEFESYQSRG